MIPFSQLTEDPYNMVNGQMIVVRSQAVNVNGSGLWSEENEPIVPVVLSGIVVDVSIEDNEEIFIVWTSEFSLIRSSFDASKTFTIYYAPG
jgi:hypothetical protein